MSQVYFVSDLHLQNMREERSQVFLRWLSSLRGPKGQHGATDGASPCSHLFLVGDIFDLWIADHSFFSDLFAPIIDQVKRLSGEGVEVHFFEGNHDLYLRPFWQQKVGITVHEGPAVFTIDNKKIRIEHGDQSDPDDRGYRFLRWFLRTPVLRWMALHLPGFAVVWLGQRASAKSRNYTSEVKTVTETEARRKLHIHAEAMARMQKFDLLVNGHVHVEDDYTFNVGDQQSRAINLGSWLDSRYRTLSLNQNKIEFIDLK